MPAHKPLNPWKLSGYKVGQNVVCKVTHPELGGYAVIIPKDNLPGFVTTSAIHKVNEEIIAEFVCVQDNRLLLCSRKRGPNHGSVQAEERADPEKLSEYNSGQLVMCKVIKSEPGGYVVITSKDKCPGFVSTRANFKDNEEILAEVLSVQENRLLLFAREDVSDRMQWNNASGDKLQNPWGYLPGRKLVCKVISSDPGGYSALILERNLTGFIRSRAHFKVDEVIVAEFNCFHNGQILLSTQFFDKPVAEDGPDQQGAPVPKNPLPVIGDDALSVPLPKPEQDEKFEFE